MGPRASTVGGPPCLPVQHPTPSVSVESSRQNGDRTRRSVLLLAARDNLCLSTAGPHLSDTGPPSKIKAILCDNHSLVDSRALAPIPHPSVLGLSGPAPISESLQLPSSTVEDASALVDLFRALESQLTSTSLEFDAWGELLARGIMVSSKVLEVSSRSAHFTETWEGFATASQNNLCSRIRRYYRF